jgi:acyl carrier protein
MNEPNPINQKTVKEPKAIDDVFPKVQEAFHAAFDIDPQLVSIETGPDDIPAWDSMGHVVLASSLESAFGINLDVDELMEMENVRAVVRIVTSKLQTRAQ